ncbi:MAG: HAD family hydrolase, partial [Alphaproteobacteria bacterium]
LFPDALDVLAHFRDRGLKLGLITNGAPDTQQPKIDLLNLAPHFDHMVISGALGIAKPDAAIFGHMLNRLGVNPADAAYVGDSPENDVVGAQQAGLTAIWRDHGNRPPSHHNPDYTIRQLSDIKELPILI